jgi:hypothetical protein
VDYRKIFVGNPKEQDSGAIVFHIYEKTDFMSVNNKRRKSKNVG